MAEKSVNEIARDVRALYVKGNEALVRDNLDYAISLFTQVLVREPAFYECREKLRKAQLQKAGSGGGFFKKMLSMGGSSPMIAKGQMALKKNPAEAMQIAEQILGGDPHNSMAHKLLVEAATALDMPRTAVLSLDVLFTHAPKDRDIAVQYAQALAGIGQATRAEAILSEMCRAYPHDSELGQS